MARHAAGALTQLGHNGEVVIVITGTGSEGGEVETSVNAVVDRLDVEPTEGTARVVRLAAMVFLPTASLLATPVPGDKVRLAMRLGGTVSDARITRLVTQDEGGVLVEVQT